MTIENIEEKPIIKISNLTKTFNTRGGKINALENINLDINKGEIFGIIGMSGAGKSTLVRCINLLERPTEGSILFDNLELVALRGAALNKERQSISMIFQQFNLLMQRNAISNICFPLEIAGVSKVDAEKRAKELLEVVELSDRALSYPSQLSGGQKQRVAIARALATNPKVLLCDEATSALDPKTTRAILALLKDINQKFGITIIIITHEMNVIQQICHKVAIIDGGSIAEHGVVEEIFANPKSQAAKRLVYPDGNAREGFAASSGGKLLRIVFDGRSSFEPVIANLILESQTPINIMYANTQNIEGQAMGQMIIQLPTEEEAQDRVMACLKRRNIKAEEVSSID